MVDIPEYSWKPIKAKLKNVARWGYKVSESDPEMLEPIPELLNPLEKAKDYLEKGYSLREVSRWLSAYTGNKISHEGLKRRVIIDLEEQDD